MEKHLLTSMALAFLVLFASTSVAEKKKSTNKKAIAVAKKESPQQTVASPTKYSSPAKSQESARTATAKRKGRLPRYFGQLGLDGRQRESIYALQAEYDAKIAELLAEIDALKESRSSRYQQVLEPSQLDKLKELATGPARKSTSASKSATKVASKRGKAKKGNSSDRQ